MPDESTRIEAFLRANPGFLSERGELYAALEPPLRVHGEGLADHMAASLAAARRALTDERATTAHLLATQRATAANFARVQSAVLALIAAENLAECVSEILPGLMGIDAAMLYTESPRPGFQPIKPGTIRQLLGGRVVRSRANPADAGVLYPQAAHLAQHDVLVRIPAARPAMLALISRDASLLSGIGDSEIFAFLGRVIAARLP